MMLTTTMLLLLTGSVASTALCAVIWALRLRTRVKMTANTARALEWVIRHKPKAETLDVAGARCIAVGWVQTKGDYRRTTITRKGRRALKAYYASQEKEA